jgi:hypothetical protein
MKKATFLFITCFLGMASAQGQTEVPFARYKIIPNPAASSITVEALVQLQNRVPYIKDFGQIQNIRWTLGGKEVPVKSERLEEIVMFSQAPASGEAKIVYTIKLAAMPSRGSQPGDIHIAGAPDFVYICEGLFLGLNGKERGQVDVQWELPPGWKLALGRSGPQSFQETQERFWVAGRLKFAEEKRVEEASIQIAVLERPGEQDFPWIVNSITSMFQYAWRNIGPLKVHDFGIAIFPKGSLPMPGWTRFSSIVVDNPGYAPPHEILHFWMNNNTPAWFREGVLEYMSRKLVFRKEAELKNWLKAGIAAHNILVAKTGGLKSLAASSAELERRFGGGGEDIYALMPVLAYRLDKEIQKHNPKSSLDEVFAAVCRKRPHPVDILALIKDLTGYDPKPLFEKYFQAKIEKPEELLDDRLL